MTDHFYDDDEYQEGDSPIVGCVVGSAVVIGAVLFGIALAQFVIWMVGG